MSEQFIAVFCGLSLSALAISIISVLISCKAFEKSCDLPNDKHERQKLSA